MDVSEGRKLFLTFYSFYNKVGHLGTVMFETSRNLAKQYSLSKDAISKGLSMIDTSQSAIGPYCPSFLKTPKCQVDRYVSSAI